MAVAHGLHAGRAGGQRRRVVLLPLAAAAAAALAVCNSSGFVQLPAADAPARRRLLLATVLGGATAAGGGGARAFELESNRQAAYLDKAKQLNSAADWYLFELRPLVYPPQKLVSDEVCEEMGDNCPERAGLSVISEMYKRPPQSRATVSLSRLEREFFAPMKTLATSSVFDPDTSDDLYESVGAFEKTSEKLGSAARRGDLTEVRSLYDKGRNQLNGYFKKVNIATALPEDNEYYLKPLPGDQDTLENDNFWKRRGEKWLVKKKVDAMSKGSKTARFYAKSMFGDDAVSWDVRGDRAPDFYGEQ